MMKTFESKMKKVSYKNGKLKEYNISLGVKSDINEDRFYKNDNDKMVCDVIVCFPDELEKILNEHEESQSQIQILKDSIEAKDKSIKSLQDKLSAIDEEHQKNLKAKDDEYSGEIDELKADIQIKDIEIEKMKTEFEKEIGEIKETNEKEKGNLKADYEKKIGEFREEIRKEINELNLFDENIHMSIIEHQKEISKLNIFNPEYHMKISDHEKELNDMRGNCLKLRVRENKEYSSYIEELEKLGRLDKFRNKDKAILKEMRGLNSEAIDDKAIDVNFNLINEDNGRED